VVDVADLNPIFAQRLAQYRDALAKAGINTSINSGYRSPEYQQQLIDQGVRPAAQPWRSFHQYGLAADLTTDQANYQRMWDMASQYGLHALGAYDPGHVQLAGNLADDINQYHLQGWRPPSQPAPATGAIAYSAPPGAPSRVATTAPGTTLNSSPLDIVLNAESGDRNINNTHQMTSSGQAQGNAQITTGTWNDFAPKAGIDLKQYPTPDSAPRSVQIAVASVIPLNRWANSTVQAVLAKYPGIDTSQTLGAIQSAAINPSGASGTAAGGSPAAPASTAPAAASGGWAGQLASALKPLSGDKGKSGAGSGGQADEPQPMQLPRAQPSQAMGGPMMMQPGGQNFEGRALAAQDLAQRGFSMQPQLASVYGALGAGRPLLPSTTGSTIASTMPGQATGLPPMGMPGTTLNSPSQLQMALMSGQMSPYDAYAAAGYGGGFGST
jgi:hypothetical protein